MPYLWTLCVLGCDFIAVRSRIMAFYAHTVEAALFYMLVYHGPESANGSLIITYFMLRLSIIWRMQKNVAGSIKFSPAWHWIFKCSSRCPWAHVGVSPPLVCASVHKWACVWAMMVMSIHTDRTVPSSGLPRSCTGTQCIVPTAFIALLISCLLTK